MKGMSHGTKKKPKVKFGALSVMKIFLNVMKTGAEISSTPFIYIKQIYFNHIYIYIDILDFDVFEI